MSFREMTTGGDRRAQDDRRARPIPAGCGLQEAAVRIRQTGLSCLPQIVGASSLMRGNCRRSNLLKGWSPLGMETMCMIEAVIFDLDGLLLDTERLALETGVKTLAALGHPVPLSVLQGLIGLDVGAGHKLICRWLKKELPYDDIYKPWDDAFLSAIATGIPLRPRVNDTLDLLDDLNLPRAVATNSKTDDALWKIEKAGLEGRFDAIVGRDMAVGPKPLPHVYLHAANLLGKEPSVCLALEDSDVGVRAALAAGMRVVQIPDMVPSQEGAAHHEADCLMAAMEWAGLTEDQEPRARIVMPNGGIPCDG